MLRICAVAIAAVPVAALSMAGLSMAGLSMAGAAASAKELKPKFGDIDGLYYTDIAENREACRQAVQRKIYLCSQNTGFVSNTEDRKYPGCLPIFRQQAGVCADHFRSEAHKCQGSGPARIADFTGFACTVTATVVEEGGEPEGGEPDGKTGSREPARQDRGAAQLSPKCAGMGKGAKCWLELANRPGCYIFDQYYNPPETTTWSGACSGGVAVGRGTRGWKKSGNSNESTGTLVRGKRHGRWVARHNDGGTSEGSFADNEMHGRWVFRWPNGMCRVAHFSHGKRSRPSTDC